MGISSLEDRYSQTSVSTQLSPVKAAFLFPHTVAVGVDLVFRTTSTAYFVESYEHGERMKTGRILLFDVEC